MRNRCITLIVAVLLALLCVTTYASSVQITDKFDEKSVQPIEIGGRLLVDLHADIMLAADGQKKAINWFNAGYLWGMFGDFGFAGPKSQYPDVATVDGVKSVTFTGKSVLKGAPIVPKEQVKDDTKGNLATPDSMTGNGEFAIEAWVYNPTIEPNECIVSWGAKGGKLVYPDAKLAPAKKWNHVVWVYSGAKSDSRLYVNGKSVPTSDLYSGLNIAPGGAIHLGCDQDGKPSFSGSISVLRIHEKAITAAQVARNFQGGIKLGTTFIPNVDPNQPDDVVWGKSDNPKFKQLFSPHFRMMWEPEKDVNNVMTDSKARWMLEEYEQVYELYEQLAMAAPIVSSNKNQRGDGIKYKINICINWDGGAFGGFNGARGCGYPIHGPGIVHAHELGHAYQTQQLGGLAGNWWETHTSWFSKLFESRNRKFNYNNAMIPNAMFFVSNGRNYYHCFHIFEQMGLDPDFGPMFIAKLWNTNGWDAYPFLRAEQIAPDKIDALKDQWVKMARRNITWDYPDAEKNPKGVDLRNARTLLEPIPYEPGVYRVPKHMAPQQFGYVICPLQPTAGTVTVDFEGYINPERGSDWRACLVAVNSKNEPRYGSIFSKGKNSMTLRADEKDVYLVVAATPRTMFIDMAGEAKSADYRSFEQHQFPFEVRMTGCSPKDIWAPGKPTVSGKAHPNGGGFVADTAQVDATAYVGPNAQVLGNARVQGKARIEDYAVVKDNAVVRDNAVVSGHALVHTNALVRDYAKIRDFGSTSSIVANFAKVAEHANNGGKMTEYSTAKGIAATFGTNYGTGIVDGMYAKGNKVDKGIWLTWSWGEGKNAGELDEDLGGVYAQYLFEKPHPYLALDTYGVTYGYLVGNPKVADGILTLNGKDQFVEMPKDVADMRDITISAKVNWAGGSNQMLWSAGIDARNCIYLTPSNSAGKLEFAIVRNGRAEAITANSALPIGKMVEVQVMLSDDLGTLFVDGKEVGRNDRMTLDPDDIKSAACYLGRGIDGGYFSGQIDEFTVYSIALVDSGAPSPNPAQWHIEPAAFSDSSVVMYAQTGCDPKPGVEYYFAEITGKGNNSGWQSSPVYEDKGLKGGETYTYTVKMRDADGNETEPSEPKSAKWEPSAYYVADKAPNGAPMFVMEAENFQANKSGRFHNWVVSDVLEGYRGNGVMYSSPEQGPAITEFMWDSPRLDYRFKVDQPGKYYLWVRGFGRYYRSECVYVSIDGKAPQKAFPGWQNQTYRWKNSGDANKPLEAFEIDAPGIHTLSVWMEADGSTVDAFILTAADYDQFKPTDELNIDKDMVGKGPRPSRIEKDGKLVEFAISLEQPQWSSLRPVVVSGNCVMMQAKNYADKFETVEYLFEDTNGVGKSSGWQKEPYFEVSGASADKEYAYRFKVRADGNETAWSEVAKAKWDISRAVNQPANGLIVIEAEHFTNKTDAPSGHKWEFYTDRNVDVHYVGWAGDRTDVGHSGEGYMQATPKDGQPTMGKTLDVKARLDYQVNFTKTGPHWVWVRGSGEHWLNHVVVLGLDMQSEEWGKPIELNWTGMRWARSKQFNVAKPGVQTLSIWMQQDSLLVDKIIITTDEKFIPSTETDPTSGAPNGIGPAAISRK